MSEAIRERDRMISEMLVSYRINVLDQEDMLRVKKIDVGFRQHYYVDGQYAFTVTQFTRQEDNWGINGRYRLGISYKIEFLDDRII